MFEREREREGVREVGGGGEGSGGAPEAAVLGFRGVRYGSNPKLKPGLSYIILVALLYWTVFSTCVLWRTEI